MSKLQPKHDDPLDTEVVEEKTFREELDFIETEFIYRWNNDKALAGEMTDKILQAFLKMVERVRPEKKSRWFYNRALDDYLEAIKKELV